MVNNIRTLHFDATDKKSEKKIIFIHGYAATSEYFHDFYKNNLQEEYSLDTIELPGLGLNKDVLASYNIESFAEYCINLINEFQWRDFILIGHSMGGAIVELICNKIPDFVQKAVILCPMNSSFSLKLLQFLTAKKGNDINSLKYNLNLLYYDPEKIYKNDEEIIKAANEAREYRRENRIILTKILHSFLSLKLRRKLIEAEENNIVPTLVLFADEDKVIDAKTGTKKLEKNKKYKVLTVLHSGHMIFIEQPESTRKAILEFLNEK